MDESLAELRKQIDAIDEKLLDILAARMSVVERIGKYKKVRGIPPLDEERWREVLASKLSRARSLNISEVLVENLYNLIHAHALEIEAMENNRASHKHEDE